jgi:hypothetical protein
VGTQIRSCRFRWPEQLGEQRGPPRESHDKGSKIIAFVEEFFAADQAMIATFRKRANSFPCRNLGIARGSHATLWSPRIVELYSTFEAVHQEASLTETELGAKRRVSTSQVVFVKRSDNFNNLSVGCTTLQIWDAC